MFGFGGGVSNMIMASSRNTDALIKEFRKRIRNGENPNDCCREVFNSLGLSEDDLTSTDLKTLKEVVEETWNEYN